MIATPTTAAGPAQAPAAAPPADLDAALDRLRAIEAEIAALVLGRDDTVRAALLAVLARQHLALLGPPGTAKSQLVELLAERLAPVPAAPGGPGGGLRCFVWLMTRYTTPDELFGPIAPLELKHNRYVRITTNKLPEAEFAFLDEIFKANSAILNALLTITHERAFDNGPERVPVPLISLFGASNELPQGEDLGALWDRFLLRTVVEYVDDGDFARLLRLAAGATPPTTLPRADLLALQAAAAALPVPDGIVAALVQLRKDLAGRGIVASDRRWRHLLGVLRAYALLEGRAAVEEDDLIVLKDILWQAPEQRQEIGRAAARLANPLNARAVELGDQAVGVYAAATDRQRDADLGDEQKL
ncbi:MAG TPA: AAA family ATPase, partial [Thermomicrobiales bacterium]|nr:AAA family ATPase [Thermomicrobiales bacterium]